MAVDGIDTPTVIDDGGVAMDVEKVGIDDCADGGSEDGGCRHLRQSLGLRGR